MAFEPINTQEEFDQKLKERLAREREKVTAETNAKYADYSELAEKAKAYDEAQEANKTELQKANDRIAALEGEKKKREEADKQREIREKVSKETGIPADLISGADEESMTSYAKKLAEFAKVQTPAAPKDPNPGKFSSGEGTNDEQREFARALLGKD